MRRSGPIAKWLIKQIIILGLRRTPLGFLLRPTDTKDKALKRAICLVATLLGLIALMWMLRRRFVSIDTKTEPEIPQFRVSPPPDPEQDDEINPGSESGPTPTETRSNTKDQTSPPAADNTDGESAVPSGASPGLQNSSDTGPASVTSPEGAVASSPTKDTDTRETPTGTETTAASSDGPTEAQHTGNTDTPAVAETTTSSNPLMAITGIGSVFAERLQSMGIASIFDLAQASPSKLAESLDITLDRASKWVRRALEIAAEQQPAV